MGSVRCPDGAFSLREVGEHTSKVGRIYFPSGTLDLDDLRGGAVDIAGSVAREVEEETGLTPADYRPSADWDFFVPGPAIAIIRILDVDTSSEALPARIEANLSRPLHPQPSPTPPLPGATTLTSPTP